MTVEKFVDKASPKLHDRLASGEHMPEVRLEIVPAGNPRNILVITMTDVVISRIVERPAVGGERPTEAVTFTCQALAWRLQPPGGASRVSTPPYVLTPKPR